MYNAMLASGATASLVLPCALNLETKAVSALVTVADYLLSSHFLCRRHMIHWHDADGLRTVYHMRYAQVRLNRVDWQCLVQSSTAHQEDLLTYMADGTVSQGESRRNSVCKGR